MELKLENRRPRWYEKKWRIKKPTLYIIELVDRKWVNTYWWEGNWKKEGLIEFRNSGRAILGVGANFIVRMRPNSVWWIIGKSGTILSVGKKKVKGLNPNTSEWTFFGKINRLGVFVPVVEKFDFKKEIEKSQG